MSDTQYSSSTTSKTNWLAGIAAAVIGFVLAPGFLVIAGGIGYALFRSQLSRPAKAVLAAVITLTTSAFGFWVYPQLQSTLSPTQTVGESQQPQPTTMTAGQVPSTSPQVLGTQADVAAQEFFLVTKVIDGDTIEIEGGRKVRYIGIDTPESTTQHECFGKEASSKNAELVLGKRVRLEKDVSETDRYGRLLRYVYLEDGTFVNQLLVSSGFANARSYPPDIKHQELFRAVESAARQDGLGLWLSCPTDVGVQQVEPLQNSSPSPPSVTQNGTLTGQQCQYSCTSPDRDCSDFSKQIQAQTFFDCCGFSAATDPMNLDSGNQVGDGIVCESLD